MFEVFLKNEQDGVIQSFLPGGQLLTDKSFLSFNLFEIEEVYFRLTQIRTDKQASVLVVSGKPELVMPAHYRTDADFSGNREQETERWTRVWAMPEEGWQGPPTRPLLQGALSASGLTQAHAAQMLGILPTSFRRWLNGNREMPWTAWFALLVRSGLLKNASR